jgi:hypothetical protein
MRQKVKFFALATLIAISGIGLYAQNASGVYETDFSKMTLQQVGNTVTGTYEHSDGRIEGTIVGNTLTGWWYQNNGKGRLVFVFNRDFSAFSGAWSYENAEPSDQWNGRRIGGALAAPSMAVYSVAGTYDTSYGEMILKQSGSKVTGSYTDGGGTIDATLSGTTLSGYWIQSNGRGRINFVFDATFSSFKGAWSYNEDTPYAGWDGQRRGPPVMIQPAQALTPPAPKPPAPSAPPVPVAPQAPAQSQADAVELFNNWNKAAVYNGPTGSTYFYLSRQTTITRIITYHWNNGRGRSPGQIAILGPDGRVYGPWNAAGTGGTGGAPNVNWIVTPNVTLAAGLYLINDSDPSTWSHNSGSFGSGFTNVSGR